MIGASDDRRKREPSRITARELLVDAAGDEHAEHSVAGKSRHPPRGRLEFRCSCGALCMVPATPENALALQNVPIDSEETAKS